MSDVIYIDIGNCLAKSYKSFIAYFNRELSASKNYDDFGTYHFDKVYGTPSSIMWEIWYKIYTGIDLFAEIEKEVNAELVTKVIYENLRTIILTSRPSNLRQATLEWLKRNLIHCHEIVFVDKYGNSEIELDKGYLIEDNLDYLTLVRAI